MLGDYAFAHEPADHFEELQGRGPHKIRLLQVPRPGSLESAATIPVRLKHR